jgi:hypothetical protein
MSPDIAYGLRVEANVISASAEALAGTSHWLRRERFQQDCFLFMARADESI